MPAPTVEELIADLKDAFPRQRVSEATFEVYVRELTDVPADVLAVTVRELVRSSEFFPSISAIRQAAAERTLTLPSEAEALTQIEARMKWALDQRIQGDEHVDPPPVHPLVREALDHVGGWHAIRAAERAEVVRGQLLRIYRDLRAEAVRGAQVGPLALPGGPPRGELSP